MTRYKDYSYAITKAAFSDRHFDVAIYEHVDPKLWNGREVVWQTRATFGSTQNALVWAKAWIDARMDERYLAALDILPM
jgi:hypothetical protein